MPELMPFCCSIHCCRLIKMLGNILKSGKENHHLEATALPCRQNNNTKHSSLGIIQKFKGPNSHASQQGIQQSIIGIVNISPQNRNNDQRENGWGKECQSVNRNSFQFPVYQKRQPQGQTYLKRNYQNYKDKGVYNTFKNTVSCVSLIKFLRPTNSIRSGFRIL